MTNNDSTHTFLQGGGEMGELIRSINWAETPIGPVDNWPTNLKLAVGIILSTPFPMYIAWGKEYTQIYNDGYRPILGSTKHPQAMGISTRETFAEVWEILDPMFGGVMEGKAVGFPNFMLPLDRNGYVEECYFDFSYSPLTNDDGSIGGVLVTVIETTENLKNLESLKRSKEELLLGTKALAESEARFRAMIEQSPVPMLVTKGEDMIFVEINPPMLDLIGRNASVKGKPWFEAIPELEGQPIMEKLYHTYRTGQEWMGFEEPIKLYRTGKTMLGYYNISYKPFFENGKIAGVLQSAIDVTEQVMARQVIAESEARFRSMMETISQMAWTVTVNAEATFFNKRWYDFTGLDYEQTKALGWQSVVHPDDLKRSVEKFRLMQSDTDVGGGIEIRFKRYDGQYRWHLARMLPITNDEGEIKLWVGTATDIHDLKELQQQKDDFISIASHELKTPITSLKASLQLLKRAKDNLSSAMAENLIEQANKSMAKVSILIEDLLNASKVTDGQLHLNKTYFTLAEMIGTTCPHIRAEGVYNLIIDGDKNLKVYADAERIDQVVVNFVNNAVKYAPESKDIHIAIEESSGWAKVIVSDNGPGIPEEKLPHLFDRYYRVDKGGNQYSGLGLGLYICAEIIKKHNGKIGVNSQPGKGSAFWFLLPVAD